MRLRFGCGVLDPTTVVRTLMAASRRSRSDWSCLTISSIGMGGIVALIPPSIPRGSTQSGIAQTFHLLEVRAKVDPV